MIGIVSYGTYIPKYRIKLADIAAAWKKEPAEVVGSLGIEEKAVPATDEDAVTMALEAAQEAVSRAGISPEEIETLFVGSESHPYAVNPTSTIVGELLGVGRNYLAADLQFACKAATAGIQAIAGLLGAGHAALGLAIGADTAQSKPHDLLEYTSGAGAVAFLMSRVAGSRSAGGEKAHLIANLLADTSYSSDTPDFWRRDGIRYPSHAGRFTGEPAYMAHVMGASRRLLEMTKTQPSDYTYCVFHMPNGKFPRDVARRLGFTKEQIAPSLIVDDIGNPYSAATMMGLSAVLDIAHPGDKIFMVSYGSGAGSDGFVWEVTDDMLAHQLSIIKKQNTVRDQIRRKQYVDYLGYLKQTHKL